MVGKLRNFITTHPCADSIEMIQMSHEAFSKLRIYFNEKLFKNLEEFTKTTDPIDPEAVLQELLLWVGEAIFKTNAIDLACFNLVEQVYSGSYKNPNKPADMHTEPHIKAVLEVLPSPAVCEENLMLRTKCVLALLDGGRASNQVFRGAPFVQAEQNPGCLL